MLDDPQDQELPEMSNGPAGEPGFSPEPSQSAEPPAGGNAGLPDDSLPKMQQPETGTDNRTEIDQVKGKTDSMVQRLTGMLRGVTGPLQDPGSLPGKERKPPAKTRRSRKPDEISTGRLDSVFASRPMKNAPPASEKPQPSLAPENRGEAPASRTETAESPEMEEAPRTGIESSPAPQQPGGGGSIPEVDPTRMSMETDQGKTKTGSLIQRITGSLRRVTGPLHVTDSLPTSAETEPEGGLTLSSGKAADADQKEKTLPKKQKQAGPDYISEIRQNLASEETARTTRGTGGLFKRITGTLRRVTGTLRATDALPPKESTPAPETVQPGAAAEMADDFLTGRLGGATVIEPEINELPAIEEPQPILLPDNWGDLPDSGIEAAELLEMEEEQVTSTEIEPEIRLGDDEPITLLEIGTIAAWGRAEEASEQEEEPDWMAEIRREAASTAGQTFEVPAESLSGEEGTRLEAEPDQTVEDRSGRRGTTGQLITFISDILGRPAEKRKQPEETEFPDEMVTDRLGRSLGSEPEQAPAPQAEELFETAQPPDVEIQAEPVLPQPTAEEGGIFGTVEEESSLLEGLEVSFSQIEGTETGEAYSAYELHPEDEALLWGEQAPSEQIPGDSTSVPEDIWGKEKTGRIGFGSEMRQEIWGEEIQPEVPPEPTADDAYAAAFLAGKELALDDRYREDQEGLRNEPRSESISKEEDLSVQDLRSIALEDYEEGEYDFSAYRPKIDWGDEEETAVAEPVEAAEAAGEVVTQVEPEVEEAPALTANWRTWLATRKISQKLLLAEGALVVLAMLVAVPFFIYMIIRGPVNPAGQLVPNALPAGVPYPTGLSLPGGWYFPLEKSTIANGLWRPVTSEWLEGTELRRVVALPWNQQTEAVTKTFQAGDPVELYFSNNTTLKYKVTSIERTSVSNTQIYTDTRSSLAIILYKEKDSSRWVVICKP